MVGILIRANKSVSLDDMQKAVEESACEVNGFVANRAAFRAHVRAVLTLDRPNAYNFAHRLAYATKKPVDHARNWRTSYGVPFGEFAARSSS